MSPQLARSDFYLAVLNEPADLHAHRMAAGGPLAADLYLALLHLAERVRSRTACTPADIERLNRLFDVANGLQLQVVQSGDEFDPAGPGPLGRATLRAVIRGDQCHRVYLEAIISLLEAAERGSLELNRCEECHNWYIPYSRAAITRFCSSRCRSRHNYRMRREAPIQIQEELR